MPNRIAVSAKRALDQATSSWIRALSCATAVVAALIFLPADAKGPLRPLDNKSIRAIFSNAMARPVGDDGSDMFGNTEWFFTDGAYNRPVHHGNIEGTYTVVGGQVCVVDRRPRSFCRNVYRNGRKIYFARHYRPNVAVEYTFSPLIGERAR